MGERSSATVVTAFRDWFDERVEELYEQEEPETELFDDWDNLIQSLHIRLKDNSEKAGFRSGTTVEAVLFMKGRYYICHVGDCRTYIISDTLTQLTTDHTIVQRELTEGKLTPEQARKDSRQSLLLQCVGAGKDVKPDYLSGEVLPHRTFLICCDGFRRKVTEAEIKKSCRYSSKEKKLHEALEETAQLCMKRKETDNITGILISAVGEKKGLFPLWKKATQTAGKKVIKDIQMNTNRSFAIYNNTEVVIGKGSQANIIVSNPIISRAHAKISCRNGVCTIQDLGSKNGTFVGDEKILGSNTVTLANGMYITLGNEIFQFKN